MNRNFKTALFLICILFSLDTFGQITSFTGKIVDEHNTPVSGSHMRLRSQGKIMDVVADEEGVISIPQIAVGDYLIDINAQGRVVRSKKIYVQRESRMKMYYNFKLYSKGVSITLMPWNQINSPVYGGS